MLWAARNAVPRTLLTHSTGCYLKNGCRRSLLGVMDSVNDMSSPSPKQSYLRCSSKHVPCPQAVGYTMGRSLGSGSFAKVRAAWSPFELKMIAIKIINKTKLSPEGLTKFLPRELEIMQKLSHPNIISLLQVIETDHHCFVAMELAENGDLLDYLCTRGHLSEAESRFIFDQMCQAIAYCHSMNIAHRDLKPENVFFSKAMDVKIGDFGFALETTKNVCSTACGPYWYGAPEISSKKEYNPLIADAWSMGMIVHVMVCGGLPYGNENQLVVKLIWEATSKEFKAMVGGLLTVETSSRPSVTDISTHEWITSYPSTRPSWNITSECKFSKENCLPLFLRSVNTESCARNLKVIKSSYPRYNKQECSLESAVLATDKQECSLQSAVLATDKSLESAVLATDTGSLDCSLKSIQTRANMAGNNALSNSNSKFQTQTPKDQSIVAGVKAVGKRLKNLFRKLRQPRNTS